MKEEWCDIDDYPDYMISNQGRIFSVYMNDIKKLQVDPGGYYQTNLVRNRVSKTFRVHRLVAWAFCPGWFEGAVVNHADGNKKNNFDTNLEWETYRGNNLHAFKNGLSHAVKKKVKVVETGEIFDSHTECAIALGNYTTNISRVLNHPKRSLSGYHLVSVI